MTPVIKGNFNFLLIAIAFVSKLIPVKAIEFYLDKVEILEYNKAYVADNVSLTLVTMGRRKRALDISVTTLKTVDNNFTANFVYEEFINNEYKMSFVGLKFKFCDFINSPYVALNKRYGLDCPILPRNIIISKLTVNWESLPNLFPFKKGRIAGWAEHTKTKERIGTIHVYTHIN